MRDIIENLTGLIPALLSIMWILRIVSKRRKSTKASSQGKPAPKPFFRKPEAAVSSKESETKKMVKKRLPNPHLESLFEVFHDPITGASRPVIAPVKARRKDVPMTENRPSSSRPADKAPDTVPLEDMKNKPNTSPVKYISPILARLDRLPPLERAMIWSFILDKPPGIKDG
ncbi:MAG: hypothetical protein B6D68_01290 [spirochete symbiont of Stewartia floridana]|nr:MAG: hypothetical protein B6D68_01290 [spirochete symbiont of Stewartia floridana]